MTTAIRLSLLANGIWEKKAPGLRIMDLTSTLAVGRQETPKEVISAHIPIRN